MNAATTATLAVDCRCELGEGPQWHAERQRLYWCDILEKRLHWLHPQSGSTVIMPLSRWCHSPLHWRAVNCCWWANTA